MEEFTLINKQRNRIKIFKPFEDISKPSPTIKVMAILYAWVYKRSSKPIIKGSRVEYIEDARKNISNYLKRVGRRPVFIEVILSIKVHFQTPKAIT